MKGTKRTYTSFDDATRTHPFVDRSHYDAVITEDYVCRAADGELLFVFLKGVLDPGVVKLAADVCRKIPVVADQRKLVHGGAPPLSGIAGYYDYFTTPVATKCRKTAFTHDHLQEWRDVFPFVEHANEAYRRALPEKWGAQDAAIPDAVRIRGSAFSTMTVNQDFRTAAHTDSGDFDSGFGFATVLEGEFEGLMLGVVQARVCVDIRPGDVLLFNTHCVHANTEVEAHLPSSPAPWSRLSCILYFRYRLGEQRCVAIYRALKAEADLSPDTPATQGPGYVPSDNLTKQFTPAPLDPLCLLLGMCGASRATRQCWPTARRLAALSRCGLLVLLRWVGAGGPAAPRAPHELRTPRESHPHATGERNTKRQKKEKTVLGFSPQQLALLESDIARRESDALSDDAFGATTFGAHPWDAWCAARDALASTVRQDFAKTRTQQVQRRRLRRQPQPQQQQQQTTTPATWAATSPGARARLTTLLDATAALFQAKNGVAAAAAPPGDVKSFFLGCLAHLARRLRHSAPPAPCDAPPEPDCAAAWAAYFRLAYAAHRVPKYLEGLRQASVERPSDASPEDSPDDDEVVVVGGSPPRPTAATPHPPPPASYTRPRMAPWLSNRCFDYQTEDERVEYREAGLPQPAESVGLQRILPVAAFDDTGPPQEGGAVAPLRIALWCEAVGGSGGGVGAAAPPGFAEQLRLLLACEARVPQAEERLRREGVSLRHGRPSSLLRAAPAAERCGCVVMVGALSALCSPAQAAGELRAAASLLLPEGLLVVKEFAPHPIDASLLTPEALEASCAAALAHRRHLQAGACGSGGGGGGGGGAVRHGQAGGQGCVGASSSCCSSSCGEALPGRGGGGAVLPMMGSAELHALCGAAGLRPVCGVVQVPGSAVHEYYAVFRKG